jgi:DNA-binding CsgD family transcriptional regulator
MKADTLCSRFGDTAAGAPIETAVARQHLHQRLMLSYKLTEREAEVAELAATGLTNAGIAARLAITLPTVKTHLLRVLAKTASGNRTQLAALLTQSSI